MAYEFQIAVDSPEPHKLADWWAETLGWRLEPQDENFIKEMIAKGYASEADTLQHNGNLVWRAGQALRHPEDLPGAPRVLFQYSPDAKTVKNRMHLDLRLGGEDRDAVRDRLIARGATFLWQGSQGPQVWYTMADPEGNEFCVS